MDKIGVYPFMAEPFHCDFGGRLMMGHLGNHMLNAADFGDAEDVHQVQCGNLGGVSHALFYQS